MIVKVTSASDAGAAVLIILVVAAVAWFSVKTQAGRQMAARLQAFLLAQHSPRSLVGTWEDQGSDNLLILSANGKYSSRDKSNRVLHDGHFKVAAGRIEFSASDNFGLPGNPSYKYSIDTGRLVLHGDESKDTIYLLSEL